MKILFLTHLSISTFCQLIFIFLFWNEIFWAAQIESKEIGPSLDPIHLMKTLKRDSQKAFQRKCKKISGDDNAYAKAMEAKDQVKVCIRKWTESEDILESLHNAERTQNYKPFIKKWVL